MPRPLRIVVLGIMGETPYAGQAWLYLNWLRGLSRLGHDVWYVEDHTTWPYDPVARTLTSDCEYAVAHVRRCMEAVGLTDRWAFRFTAEGPARTWGLTAARLDALYRDCDALLNIVGATVLREEHLAAPLRVYVETDPVKWQLRIASGDTETEKKFAAHHVAATYGENYGAPDCRVPLNGAAYVTTRQPVDLDLWPMVFAPRARRFTTIGNYRFEGQDVSWNGKVYRWSKHHEWEKFLELPSRTGQPFEMAAQKVEPEDRRVLKSHGWRVTPAEGMSLEPFGRYPDYIRRSRAEFTVAKEQNILLRSGWFSERDACYLASGKPVVAQDTAFANILPTGDGLFSVRNLDEAVEAVGRIAADYRHHARAAREVAEEHFDATSVAAKLLSDIGLTA